MGNRWGNSGSNVSPEVWLFGTPWTAAHQAYLSFTISLSLFKLMSIDAIQPSHPLSTLLFLPSVFPSIRVFSNELVFHIRWPMFGASALSSVLPMNIHGWFPLGLTGLISLLSKGLSRVFFSTSLESVSSLTLNLLYGPTVTQVVKTLPEMQETPVWFLGQEDLLEKG